LGWGNEGGAVDVGKETGFPSEFDDSQTL
jgi:hypothetical protein